MSESSSNESGFTLIEVIISIVIAGVVFVGLASSVVSIFSITEGSSQRMRLSNLAYANMRLYADGNKPYWFSCNTSDELEPITLLDKSEAVDGLPEDVTQTVIATAVYGCDGEKQGYPILVRSTATLTNGRTVSHATYATY